MAKQPKSKNWPHKVRPVKVSDMRVPPVGVAQRRYSRAQAEEYAANFDPNKLGIPAVNHRDGIYWIVDGQHRIEALKLWFAPDDPGHIDCNVYVDLTDEEMAELFIGLNTRRAVNSFDLFLTACSAKRSAECEIRRVVESNGLKIEQSKDENAIGVVSALRRVHERAGAVVLGQSLRALRDGLAGDRMAFDGQLLQGVANVFNRYNGKTDEKTLARALAAVQQGASAILRRAESQRERTGNLKAQCVAAVVVDLYNKEVGPRNGGRLPAWWKEQ
jgi:hypothetical protein